MSGLHVALSLEFAINIHCPNARLCWCCWWRGANKTNMKRWPARFRLQGRSPSKSIIMPILEPAMIACALETKRQRIEILLPFSWFLFPPSSLSFYPFSFVLISYVFLLLPLLPICLLFFLLALQSLLPLPSLFLLLPSSCSATLSSCHPFSWSFSLLTSFCSCAAMANYHRVHDQEAWHNYWT